MNVFVHPLSLTLVETIFMLTVLLIGTVAAGSLSAMHNANRNMMAARISIERARAKG